VVRLTAGLTESKTGERTITRGAEAHAIKRAAQAKPKQTQAQDLFATGSINHIPLLKPEFWY
jgi:hypothetical protein